MNQLRAYRPLPLVAAAFLFTAVPSLAQTPAPDPVPVAAPLPAQIELNLINLPTTMSIARHKGYFRLTHRFASDLRRGSLSQNAADLFTLDKGAIIGLEYRSAITGNIQAGRWDALRQGHSFPLSASLTLSYEGLNNLREKHQTGVAVTVSRTFGDRLALYATPAFVAGTHAVDFIAGHEDHDDIGLVEDEHSNHDDTWFAGIGGRFRFSHTGYIAGEDTRFNSTSRTRSARHSASSHAAAARTTSIWDSTAPVASSHGPQKNTD